MFVEFNNYEGLIFEISTIPGPENMGMVQIAREKHSFSLIQAKTVGFDTLGSLGLPRLAR